jgi:Na+/pantothenate symporter
MIASAITMAVGLYVFIMALQSQWNGGSDFLTIGLQYALGFIIFAFGKMCTWKSKACCPAHSKA